MNHHRGCGGTSNGGRAGVAIVIFVYEMMGWRGGGKCHGVELCGTLYDSVGTLCITIFLLSFLVSVELGHLLIPR